MYDSIRSTLYRRVARVRLQLPFGDSPSLKKMLGCVLVSRFLTPNQYVTLQDIDPDKVARRMRLASAAGLLCLAPQTTRERAQRSDPREACYMLTEAGVRAAIRMFGQGRSGAAAPSRSPSCAGCRQMRPSGR
jgi:hypothetical protein